MTLISKYVMDTFVGRFCFGNMVLPSVQGADIMLQNDSL